MMQTNKNVHILVIGFLILLQYRVYSQNALVPDILPSANATALGKYGEFPVSYYTGQANISIPLHFMETNGVGLSFNIEYDGSGILVNNHDGWLGQNWTLKGGGVITRTVNGIADELGHFSSDSLYNVNRSYFAVINYDNFLTENNTDSYNELKQFAINKLTPPPIRYRDTEPDIFHFSVNGISGKFFYGEDGTWKVVSEQNIKVLFDTTDPDNFQNAFINMIPNTPGKKFEKVIKGFKITDEAGTIYTFGYDPNSVEYSIPFFTHYTCPEIGQYVNWIANAWHLTKIEDFKGNTLFSLTYQRSFFTGQLYESRNINQKSCKLTNENWLLASSNASINISGSLTSPVYLSNVFCLNGDRMEFNISNAIEKKMDWTTNMIVHYEQLESQTCHFPILPFLEEEGYYSFAPTSPLNNPLEALMWKKLNSIEIYKNGLFLSKST